MDVSGAEAVFDDGLNGFLDGVCRGGEAERVAEQHCGRQDLCDGVCDAFTRDVGCGAAAGFEESEPAGGEFAFAEGSAGEHPEGTGDHCHFVREDVAEEIFCEDDVE
ncbi:MAG: hypothetical protein RIS92_1538 [Verrucomicrobiota bacterium]